MTMMMMMMMMIYTLLSFSIHDFRHCAGGPKIIIYIIKREMLSPEPMAIEAACQ